MSSWICADAPVSSLTPDDRGFAYGDGLFETIAIRQGLARFWPFHCERLLLGCMRLGIPAPTLAELDQVLARTLPIDTPCDGTLKLLLTRGDGPRGYRLPRTPRPQLWSRFWPEDATSLSDAEGSSVALQFAEMTLSRQSALAGMKHLNRLEQVLGGKNAHEVLFCDTHQNVVCGRMSNVFFVSDNRLCTPGLSHSGVAGIARRAVLQVAHSSGVKVDVDDFKVAQLQAADEVFVCNSRYLLRPVSALAGRPFALGPQTSSLAKGVLELARSI